MRHAWALGEDGRVVDPTWDHPADNVYFGITVPAERYVRALVTMSPKVSMPLLKAVFVLRLWEMP
jgi:hypothetical protein